MTKLINKAKNLFSNEAVAGTIIVTIGSFGGNIMSYLTQIFLGRALTVVEYGVFNSLLSISVIVGVLSTAFSTALVKIVADLKASERFDVLTQLFWSTNKLSAIVGIITAILIVAFEVPVARFLNLSDPKVLTGFAVAMGFSYIRVVPLAYLQGLLRFKAYAFTSVFANFTRLLAAVLAIWLGYRVGGVYLLMGIFSVLFFAVSTWLLKKNFAKYEKKPLDPHYSKIWGFLGPVFFVQVGMILLNNTDIILVKHYFDEFTAGLYSGLVTVGKVYLFAANTVAVVMYPMVAGVFARKEDYNKKAQPFLYLQTFVVLLGLLVFGLFSSQIVHVMFGPAYAGAVEYLFKFAVFMGLYVMLNFMTLFLLAIEKTKVYVLQIFAVFAQAALLVFFHRDLHQVVNVNLAVSGVLFASVTAYYFRLRKS